MKNIIIIHERMTEFYESDGNAAYEIYLEASVPVPTAVISTIVIRTVTYQWDFNLNEDILISNDTETITLTIQVGNSRSSTYVLHAHSGNSYDTTTTSSLDSYIHLWETNSKYQLGTHVW